MLKELNHTVEITEMKLTRRDIEKTGGFKLWAMAKTGVVNEVRVKYHREEGYSKVWADITVDADADNTFCYHAIVHVEITYEGDMVMSSSSTRRKINTQLEKYAQEECLKEVHKELFKKENQK